MGICTAPFQCQQAPNWCAHQLRQKGLRVLCYLDNVAVIARSESQGLLQMKQAMDFFTLLGWILSPKVDPSPTQDTEFLGLMFNTCSDTIAVPPDKVTAISRLLHHFLKTKEWSLRQCQKVNGHLNFVSLAVPLGTLNSRLIQRGQRGFKRKFPRLPRAIPPLVLAQLQWWLQNIQIPSQLFHPPPSLFVATDASNEGWGATVNGSSQQGVWNSTRQRWHINRKEMWVVMQALQSAPADWDGKTLLLQSDNTATVSSLNKQGTT